MHHSLLLPTLLELLAKSALLLLGAVALAAAARRLSAAQHHALWMAALATLLLLPFTKCVAPRWHFPGSPTVPSVTVLSEMPNVVIQSAIQASNAKRQGAAFRLPDARDLAIGAWLAGTAAIIGYRFFGSLQLVRLRRRCVASKDEQIAALAAQVAAEMNLHAPYSICLGEEVSVPCTWGSRHPVVLLPAQAEQWEEDRLLAALRHEFGHVTRRDYLTRWMALLACALYWPNPLVWFASRRLRMAQEQACDDLVLRAGTPPGEYASLLVETARVCLGASSELHVAVAMARPSTLEGRVLAIVDETRNRQVAGRATRLVGALCIITLIGASALAQIAPEKSASPANGVLEAETQILISCKFIESPKGALPKLFTDGARAGVVRSKEEAKELWRKLQTTEGVNILSAPQVTVLSGQAARVQVGREYALPAGSQPAQKFVGTTLKATPIAKGQTIDIGMTAQYVALKEEATIVAGKPVFDDRKVATQVTIFDGSTVLVNLGSSEKEGREFSIILEAHKLSPDHGAANNTTPGGDLKRAPEAGKDAAPPSKALKKAQEIVLPKAELNVEVTSQTATFDQKTNAAVFSGNATVKVNRPGQEPMVVEADELKITGVHNPPQESAALKQAREIILPKVELREASLVEAVDFLRAKAAEAAPDKLGVNVVLKPGVRTDASITLSLSNVSFMEALRYAATLANNAVVAEPEALVIEPAK